MDSSRMDSPEGRFLRLVLHPTASPERVEAAAALLPEVDREGLFDLAAEHGVLWLAYRGMLALARLLPDLTAWTDALAPQLTQNASFYEFIYPGQLATVLSALADVDTLLMKGYHLGSAIYGGAALRPYGDFDLLIPVEQHDAADAALRGLGYKPFTGGEDWTHHHHLPPYVHETFLPVEVHRTPMRDIAFDLPSIWAASEPFQVNGVATRVMCREHLLVYLCVHAAHSHLFEMGLKPVCDVYELLKDGELDWDAVIETSRAWDCERHVYLMLRVVEYVFDWSAPLTIRGQLSRAGFDESFLDYSLGNLTRLNQATWRAAQVIENPTMSGVTWLVWSRLFPSEKALRIHYDLPPQTGPLWPYRLRWWGRLPKMVVRFVRRDAETYQRAEADYIRRQMAAWLGVSER